MNGPDQLPPTRVGDLLEASAAMAVAELRLADLARRAESALQAVRPLLAQHE